MGKAYIAYRFGEHDEKHLLTAYERLINDYLDTHLETHPLYHTRYDAETALCKKLSIAENFAEDAIEEAFAHQKKKKARVNQHPSQQTTFKWGR